MSLCRVAPGDVVTVGFDRTAPNSVCIPYQPTKNIIIMCNLSHVRTPHSFMLFCTLLDFTCFVSLLDRTASSLLQDAWFLYFDVNGKRVQTLTQKKKDEEEQEKAADWAIIVDGGRAAAAMYRCDSRLETVY